MKYDLIIIGGGPAGLTAAMYASRYKLKTLLITKIPGGIATTAHKICNFPTYEDISGFDLMKKMEEHVKKLNAEMIYDEVIKISSGFKIKTAKNKTFEAKKMILAAGTERKKLNIPREMELLGRGISYCGTCDGPLFRNKNVAVAGGGNGAVTTALLLADYADIVYLIYRGDKFRADPVWLSQLKGKKKIKQIFREDIAKLEGEKFLEAIELKSGKKLKVDGLFIEVGAIPDQRLISQLKIKTDSKGYIIADKQQRTNINGIYAAGDITNNSLKQIITACGEGATAANSAYQDLNK